MGSQPGTALTVEWIQFESVGSGSPVGGPSHAEGVITNVVGGKVSDVQVHCERQEQSINQLTNQSTI